MLELQSIRTHLTGAGYRRIPFKNKRPSYECGAMGWNAPSNDVDRQAWRTNTRMELKSGEVEVCAG